MKQNLIWVLCVAAYMGVSVAAAVDELALSACTSFGADSLSIGCHGSDVSNIEIISQVLNGLSRCGPYLGIAVPPALHVLLPDSFAGWLSPALERFSQLYGIALNVSKVSLTQWLRSYSQLSISPPLPAPAQQLQLQATTTPPTEDPMPGGSHSPLPYDVLLHPAALTLTLADQGLLTDLGHLVSHLGRDLDWLDIPPMLRLRLATYDSTIPAVPLDGSALVLMYRNDVPQAQRAPATWQELLTFVQNYDRERKRQARSSSSGNASSPYPPSSSVGAVPELPPYALCLPRGAGCSRLSYLQSIWSSIAQTRGSQQGVHFDPVTLRPLLDTPAAEKAFRIMGQMLEAAAPLEPDEDCSHGSLGFARGQCALVLAGFVPQMQLLSSKDPIASTTSVYCVRSINVSSSGCGGARVSQQVVRVARLPGSELVWVARQLPSGESEESGGGDSGGVITACTMELCPYGVRVDSGDIANSSDNNGGGRLVNFSPLLLESVLVGSVSRSSQVLAQLAGYALLSYLASPHQYDNHVKLTDQAAVQETVSSPLLSVSPVHLSLLSLEDATMELWQRAGYDRDVVVSALPWLSEALTGPNTAMLLRMEGAGYYNALLESLLQNIDSGSIELGLIPAAHVADSPALPPLKQLRRAGRRRSTLALVSKDDASASTLQRAVPGVRTLAVALAEAQAEAVSYYKNSKMYLGRYRVSLGLPTCLRTPESEEAYGSESPGSRRSLHIAVAASVCVVVGCGLLLAAGAAVLLRQGRKGRRLRRRLRRLLMPPLLCGIGRDRRSLGVDYGEVDMSVSQHPQVTAPEVCSETAILVTDIEGSTHLWEALSADVMSEAVHLHHTCIRRLLVEHCGYESATEGDSFILAFRTVKQAVAFAVDLQAQLLMLPWPQELLHQQACAPVYTELTEGFPFTHHNLEAAAAALGGDGNSFGYLHAAATPTPACPRPCNRLRRGLTLGPSHTISREGVGESGSLSEQPSAEYALSITLPTAKTLPLLPAAAVPRVGFGNCAPIADTVSLPLARFRSAVSAVTTRNRSHTALQAPGNTSGRSTGSSGFDRLSLRMPPAAMGPSMRPLPFATVSEAESNRNGYGGGSGGVKGGSGGSKGGIDGGRHNQNNSCGGSRSGSFGMLRLSFSRLLAVAELARTAATAARAAMSFTMWLPQKQPVTPASRFRHPFMSRCSMTGAPNYNIMTAVEDASKRSMRSDGTTTTSVQSEGGEDTYGCRTTVCGRQLHLDMATTTTQTSSLRCNNVGQYNVPDSDDDASVIGGAANVEAEGEEAGTAGLAASAAEAGLPSSDSLGAVPPPLLRSAPPQGKTLGQVLLELRRPGVWTHGAAGASRRLLMFRGLRVRVGIHTGVSSEAEKQYNAAAARIVYGGPCVVACKAVADMAHGGQVFMSGAARAQLEEAVRHHNGGRPGGSLLLHIGTYVKGPAASPTAPGPTMPSAIIHSVTSTTSTHVLVANGITPMQATRSEAALNELVRRRSLASATEFLDTDASAETAPREQLLGATSRHNVIGGRGGGGNMAIAAATTGDATAGAILVTVAGTTAASEWVGVGGDVADGAVSGPLIATARQLAHRPSSHPHLQSTQTLHMTPRPEAPQPSAPETQVFWVTSPSLAQRLAIVPPPRVPADYVTLNNVYDAPVGRASYVVVQVPAAVTLLAWNERVAGDALRLLHEAAYGQLQLIKEGYLICPHPGEICAAFTSALAAVRWAEALRLQLLAAPWAEELLAHELCETVEVSDSDTDSDSSSSMADTVASAIAAASPTGDATLSNATGGFPANSRLPLLASEALSWYRNHHNHHNHNHHHHAHDSHHSRLAPRGSRTALHGDMASKAGACSLAAWISSRLNHQLPRVKSAGSSGAVSSCLMSSPLRRHLPPLSTTATPSTAAAVAAATTSRTLHTFSHGPSRLGLVHQGRVTMSYASTPNSARFDLHSNNHIAAAEAAATCSPPSPTAPWPRENKADAHLVVKPRGHTLPGVLAQSISSVKDLQGCSGEGRMVRAEEEVADNIAVVYRSSAHQPRPKSAEAMGGPYYSSHQGLSAMACSAPHLASALSGSTVSLQDMQGGARSPAVIGARYQEVVEVEEGGCSVRPASPAGTSAVLAEVAAAPASQGAEPGKCTTALYGALTRRGVAQYDTRSCVDYSTYSHASIPSGVLQPGGGLPAPYSPLKKALSTPKSSEAYSHHSHPRIAQLAPGALSSTSSRSSRHEPASTCIPAGLTSRERSSAGLASGGGGCGSGCGGAPYLHSSSLDLELCNGGAAVDCHGPEGTGHSSYGSYPRRHYHRHQPVETGDGEDGCGVEAEDEPVRLSWFSSSQMGTSCGEHPRRGGGTERAKSSREVSEAELTMDEILPQRPPPRGLPYEGSDRDSGGAGVSSAGGGAAGSSTRAIHSAPGGGGARGCGTASGSCGDSSGRGGERTRRNKRLLLRGLRMRAGIATGPVSWLVQDHSHDVGYNGKPVRLALRLSCGIAASGQVLCCEVTCAEAVVEQMAEATEAAAAAATRCRNPPQPQQSQPPSVAIAVSNNDNRLNSKNDVEVSVTVGTTTADQMSFVRAAAPSTFHQSEGGDDRSEDGAGGGGGGSPDVKDPWVAGQHLVAFYPLMPHGRLRGGSYRRGKPLAFVCSLYPQSPAATAATTSDVIRERFAAALCWMPPPPPTEASAPPRYLRPSQSGMPPWLSPSSSLCGPLTSSPPSCDSLDPCSLGLHGGTGPYHHCQDDPWQVPAPSPAHRWEPELPGHGPLRTSTKHAGISGRGGCSGLGGSCGGGTTRPGAGLGSGSSQVNTGERRGLCSPTSLPRKMRGPWIGKLSPAAFAAAEAEAAEVARGSNGSDGAGNTGPLPQLPPLQQERWSRCCSVHDELKEDGGAILDGLQVVVGGGSGTSALTGGSRRATRKHDDGCGSCGGTCFNCANGGVTRSPAAMDRTGSPRQRTCSGGISQLQTVVEIEGPCSWVPRTSRLFHVSQPSKVPGWCSSTASGRRATSDSGGSSGHSGCPSTCLMSPVPKMLLPSPRPSTPLNPQLQSQLQSLPMPVYSRAPECSPPAGEEEATARWVETASTVAAVAPVAEAAEDAASVVAAPTSMTAPFPQTLFASLHSASADASVVLRPHGVCGRECSGEQQVALMLMPISCGELQPDGGGVVCGSINDDPTSVKADTAVVAAAQQCNRTACACDARATRSLTEAVEEAEVSSGGAMWNVSPRVGGGPRPSIAHGGGTGQSYCKCRGSGNEWDLGDSSSSLSIALKRDVLGGTSTRALWGIGAASLTAGGVGSSSSSDRGGGGGDRWYDEENGCNCGKRYMTTGGVCSGGGRGGGCGCCFNGIATTGSVQPVVKGSFGDCAE